MLHGTAGVVDRLFYDVISLITKSDLPIRLPVKRQRNSPEASATLQGLRPDFMLLIGNALLLKGEDKVSYADMDDAKGELASKMADWSAAYHGKVSAVHL